MKLVGQTDLSQIIMLWDSANRLGLWMESWQVIPRSWHLPGGKAPALGLSLAICHCHHWPSVAPRHSSGFFLGYNFSSLIKMSYIKRGLNASVFYYTLCVLRRFVSLNYLVAKFLSAWKTFNHPLLNDQTPLLKDPISLFGQSSFCDAERHS